MREWDEGQWECGSFITMHYVYVDSKPLALGPWYRVIYLKFGYKRLRIKHPSHKNISALSQTAEVETSAWLTCFVLVFPVWVIRNNVVPFR